MPRSTRPRSDEPERAGYIVSPSRLVTVVYVVLLVVVVALGGTFVMRKRARIARLAAREERIIHSKETGEFREALMTVGMALQSELRHFHVGAHLSSGLKSRVLNQMGQLDAVLANVTAESIAAQDTLAAANVAAGKAKSVTTALKTVKAKVAVWAEKIAQDVDRYQQSQRKTQGRTRADLVGIFNVLQTRSHFQLLQHYGEKGIFFSGRGSKGFNKMGGRAGGGADGPHGAQPRRRRNPTDQVDPQARAEMLVESLTARQDLGLTLDRLTARVSALTHLDFGASLGARLNELAAAVQENRREAVRLDAEVTRIREAQPAGKASKAATRERLDTLAAVQKSRNENNQALRQIKDDLIGALAKPGLRKQVNFAVLQKLDPVNLPDVLREMQNCMSVKSIEKPLLAVLDARSASGLAEEVRDRDAGVEVMKFAKIGSEAPDLVHAPGALHHMLPFEWIVGDGTHDSSRKPYDWWKGYPREEIDEIEDLRSGKVPDLPVVGGSPRRGKLSDRLQSRKGRGGGAGGAGRPRKRVQAPSKEDIEFLKLVRSRAGVNVKGAGADGGDDDAAAVGDALAAAGAEGAVGGADE